MRHVERLLSRTDLEPHLRSEVLSLAGRIAKDRMAALESGAQHLQAAVQARNYYHEGWLLSGDFFPGINAATLSLLTGRAQDAQHIAGKVKARCLDAVTAANADHWLHATLGEAAVLLGERDEALRWYAKAYQQAGQRYGDLASIRRQLRLLAPHSGLAQEMLGVVPMPNVALFTGHMIDRPGRAQPRFPAHIAAAVGVALGRMLDDAGVGFAYCSAACGADILFIEQALARGIEVNVVLPFGREEFIRTSVAFAGAEWVARFAQALSQAASVSVCVDEGYLGDDVLFGFAAQLSQGLVLLRAQQLETHALLLAVADDESAPLNWGTGSNVLAWRGLGLEERILDLGDLRKAGTRVADGNAAPPAVEETAGSGGRM